MLHAAAAAHTNPIRITLMTALVILSSCVRWKGRGDKCVTYLCDIFWLHGHSLRHGHVACVCVRERERERRKRVWTTFNISIFAFFPPGPPFSPFTFPHFAALSCLNATCSRCCARTFMHHLPLPGVRVRVCVCVSYVACVAASGNCFVICVARGKAQRAKLQADNCQAAVKERVRREWGGGAGEQANCIWRLFRFRRSRKVCNTKYATIYGRKYVFLSACNHAAHE